jgi:arsenate reductase
MAEALLRRIDSENFEAVTAPIRADEIHPLTVEAMKEVGVDVLEKSLAVPDDFRNDVFDFVITLCDRAKLDVVEFQGGEQILWHFDNPLTIRDPQRRVSAFRTLRDQIAQRLHLFVLVQARSERAA